MTRCRDTKPADLATDLSVPEVESLWRGGFELTPVTTESANALAETAAEYAALCDSSLTVAETARKLGVDPGRVRQFLAARRIYGLQIQGTWKIPIFQFRRRPLAARPGGSRPRPT
jgi:hypothetical protein